MLDLLPGSENTELGRHFADSAIAHQTSKEWRDARWKLLVAAIRVMLLVFLISPYQEFVEVARRIPGEDPVDNALRDLSDLYYLSGFVVLMPLADFLGVAAISGEVSNGTILQLLPRPLSRIRLLLVKYAVGAATLLVAAVLGKVLLTCAAAVRGYPLGQLRVLEAVFSVLVLWLGVLFVLGTAVLISVIFRGVLASIVACVLTLTLVFALPNIIFNLYLPSTGQLVDLSTRLTLLTYWMPANYYYGGPRDASIGLGGFTVANFLVCLISATLPLLAALWIFRRRSY